MAIIKTIASGAESWEAARNYQACGGFDIQSWSALFDYMEQVGDDAGQPIDHDPVAWACDFSPYDSALEAYRDRCGDPLPCEEFYSDELNDYHEALEEGEACGVEEPTPPGADEKEEEALDFLCSMTVVIEHSGGVIVGP